MLGAPRLLVFKPVIAESRMVVVGRNPYYHVSVIASGGKELPYNETTVSICLSRGRCLLTLWCPSDHIDGLCVLGKRREVLEMAVLAVDFCLPELHDVS